MSASSGFTLFLLVTVALLGGVLVTGFRAKRRLHIPLVVLTLAALGATIYYAEQLGDAYDLESAGLITPIHLTLAKITTLGYVLPVWTGWRTLRDPRNRRRHRTVALTIVALTVLTLGTGLAMLLASDPVATAAGTPGPRPRPDAFTDLEPAQQPHAVPVASD